MYRNSLSSSSSSSSPSFSISFSIPFLTKITLTIPPLLAAASPLTAPLPPSLAITTPVAPPPPANTLQCIDSPDWVTPKFIAYDCFTAIALFEDYEAYRHSTTLYEFLSSSLPPPHPPFTQYTPRKYTYKSCTMAIVMLYDLPPGLPGLPSGQSSLRTDLCDYKRIENAVLNVRDGCLSIVSRGGGGRLGFVNPAGYNTAGFRGGIGVFLWDTDSVINGIIKEGVGVGVGGNGSRGVE